MHDIFISYAREDRVSAELLARALEEHGWRVWWDESIPTGRDYDDAIEEALDAAKCVVVLWSESSRSKRWVKTEAAEGLNREVLIPILIEDVTPPLAFRRVQAANLVGWNGQETTPVVRSLFSDIEGLVGGPSSLDSKLESETGSGQVVLPTASPLEGGLAEEQRAPVEQGAQPVQIGFPRQPTTVDIETSRESTGPEPPSLAVDPLNRPIWIEGGTFQMGSMSGRANEQPVHQVTVSGFWIQEHEVTNEEYRRFDPSHEFPSGRERNPVVRVTWREAVAYAEARGGRLPTEAEWEFAARGVEGRTYPWGSAAPNESRANFGGREGTQPAGSYPEGATPEGVHDLAGNVSEWVGDWYGLYGASPKTDPTGPQRGGSRVVRGGAFNSYPNFLRCAFRGGGDPGGVTDRRGFRVAWPGGQ